MTSYFAGTQVPGGYYWSMAHWGITAVSGEAGLLAGEAQERFVRVPLPLMIPLAATMSLLFVMFLPFIGFALLAWALVRPAVRALHSAAQGATQAVAPSWSPAEAYLTGKPGETTHPEGSAAGTQALEALQKEIEQRRSEQKTPPVH